MPNPPQGKGTMANATAGADAVEIKVTVAEDNESAAEKQFALERKTGEARSIFFFDTRELQLFAKGVVLRARKVAGGQDDSTVKIRPVDPASIAAKWRGLPGFKIEADGVGQRMIRSGSLSVAQGREEIEQVARGERAMEKLFSADQEAFLAQMSPIRVDFRALAVLGPIDARRWKRKDAGLPYEITAEQWRLPDGRDLLELSIKAASAQAAAAAAAFTGFLTELGLKPSGGQQTKTRTALEYFAKHSPGG